MQIKTLVLVPLKISSLNNPSRIFLRLFGNQILKYKIGEEKY
jgi:hypothetical protein